MRQERTNRSLCLTGDKQNADWGYLFPTEPEELYQDGGFTRRDKPSTRDGRPAALSTATCTGVSCTVAETDLVLVIVLCRTTQPATSAGTDVSSWDH